MATQIEAPTLVLREHKEVEKPSIYDPIVQQLIDAGPGQDGVVTVPTTTLKKHERELRKAAGKADRTARIIETNDQGDGATELVFQLREKVTRTRAKKSDSSESAATPEISDAA